MPTEPPDVPSPIDLCCPEDAREWEATALEKRPQRPQIFTRMSEEIARHEHGVHRILELGSGPGFLAERLLRSHQGVEYVMLDSSAAMHALARARLATCGALSTRVDFVERSFAAPGWGSDLGTFDCVVTVQAVHELRHKRRAVALHMRVRDLLRPFGLYLVCDHFCGDGGMENDQLFMTIDEQREALSAAGFNDVVQIVRAGSLILHRARSTR